MTLTAAIVGFVNPNTYMTGFDRALALAKVAQVDLASGDTAAASKEIEEAITMTSFKYLGIPSASNAVKTDGS